MIHIKHCEVRRVEDNFYERITARPELIRIYILMHGFNRLFSRRIGLYDFGRIELRTDGLILMNLSVAELYHLNNLTDKMADENFKSNWGLFRYSRFYNLRVHIPVEIPFKEGTELMLKFHPGKRLKNTIEPKIRLILTEKTEDSDYEFCS